MNKKWKNRIVGYGEEDPEQLVANPKNWRIHPQVQQEYLEGVIDEVGVVQNIIVNKQTGFVVDGHLRASLALRSGQKAIPVTYVDLTEEEEALIISTLDPIGAKAGTDRKKLDELVSSLEASNPAVNDLLENLAKDRDRADQTLEELDVDSLPDYPHWVLATIPVEKLPEVAGIIDELQKVDGVTVEQTNR